MFVFISRCSISCTDSVRPARILANSFSIFSICASEASFCVDVTYFLLVLNLRFGLLHPIYLFRLFIFPFSSPDSMLKCLDIASFVFDCLLDTVQ